MDQHRALVVGVAHVLQDRQQVIQIVAIDGSDVEEAEFLEEGAAGEQAARVFLRALGGQLDRAREALCQRAAALAHREKGLRRADRKSTRLNSRHSFASRIPSSPCSNQLSHQSPPSSPQYPHHPPPPVLLSTRPP